MSDALRRLKELTSKITSFELTRKENYKRLRFLFDELELTKKVPYFEDIFTFKAINLSAIALQPESFGEIQVGKYMQLLGIKKENGKSKNVSLAYFGRVESVAETTRLRVMEFVIRYRFEKSFMTLEHYYTLLERFESDG